MKHTFKKSERLSKEKWIKELFEKGSSFYLHPFKVIYIQHPDSALAHQVLITVPSRQYKKAVDRNKIKRRIREAFRTQKHLLLVAPAMAIGVLYTAKSIVSFAQIREKVLQVISTLNDLSHASALHKSNPE
ncbi:MAG: ribonuclease P protein component [Cytophagales bacterium]|nr:ribonuclease P protein component [Cytophagales bacterium]